MVKRQAEGNLSPFEFAAFNGLNNSHKTTGEMVAWAFTNREMQDYLEAIPYKAGTMWTRFVDAIKGILGLKNNTALDEVLRAGELLIDEEPTIFPHSFDKDGKLRSVQSSSARYARDRDIVNNSVSNAAQNSGDEYEANRKVLANQSLASKVRGGSAFSKAMEGIDKFLGSISTRAKNISPKIEAQLRRLDYNLGTHLSEDVKAVEPLMRQAKKRMDKPDFIDWDYARKNGDVDKINELVEKYDLAAEYKAYREVLTRMYKDAQDVGIDVGWIDEYAPRVLKDAEGFLTYLGRGTEWPIITRRLQKAAADMGMTIADMPELAHPLSRMAQPRPRHQPSPHPAPPQSATYSAAD